MELLGMELCQPESIIQRVAGSSELVTAEPVDLQGSFCLAISGCGSVPGYTYKLGKFIFGMSPLFTFMAFHLPLPLSFLKMKLTYSMWVTPAQFYKV